MLNKSVRAPGAVSRIAPLVAPFVAKLLGGLTLLSGLQAQALSLDWSGVYRFEWTEVDAPSLSSPGQRKAYGLNYLELAPTVVAADGVNIHSRFQIMSNSVYETSQLGDIWGMNATSGSPYLRGNQGETGIEVRELYLNLNQEYGALVAGRAPLHFGLGMSYSAGDGAFDHWYTTRDMVGYKVVMGNWFIMPMLTRMQSAGYEQGGTISTTAVHLQFESEDKTSVLGIFQENTAGANSALGYTTAQAEALGGAGAVVSGNLGLQKTNVYIAREFSSFGFKIEAGFQSGSTGITTSGGEDVNLSGHGLATEFYIPQKSSKWGYSLKAGMATGDDSGAKNFGAFAFHRNYNVGLLLFNHRLGQRDFLQTGAYQPTGTSVGSSADDEMVSNAGYIAPSVGYDWNERLQIRNTLVYGYLFNPVQSSVDSSKDLGLEWDIELVYKPSARVQWVNQLGLLFPGEAYKNGTDNLDNKFTFGFVTKAAISF